MSNVKWGVCGSGGIARRRYHTLFGEEGTGKSTMALLVAKAVLDLGHYEYEPDKFRETRVLYIDAEASLDLDYLEAMHFDLDRFIVARPPHGNRALDLVRTILAMPKAHQFDLIVIDSWAAMPTLPMKDGDMSDNHMATHARLYSLFFGLIAEELGNSDTAFLGINQVRTSRDKFAGGFAAKFAPDYEESGGKALRFYASTRTEMLHRVPLEVNGSEVGMMLRFKNHKNKVGMPFRKSDKGTGSDNRAGTLLRFDHPAGLGVDYQRELIDAAFKSGTFLDKNGQIARGYGSKLYLPQDGELVEVAYGKDAVDEAIAGDLDLYALLNECFYARLEETRIKRRIQDVIAEGATTPAREA
jgi:RecA/RadA recombinase